MTTKIYIIHGWTYNLDKWEKIVQILKDNNIEPIQLKVPGLTEASQKVWDIDDYVGWLDKQLQAAEKPIIVGHSNGGRIALNYVQRYPQKLGGLILIDSAGVANTKTVNKAKLKSLRRISKVGKVIARGPIAKKVFYRLIGASDYNNAPPNMKTTMQKMLDADKDIDLSKVKIPVSIIWGRDDSVTPLSDAYKIKAAIAGSTLDIIDNARHAPFYTQPNEVADIIIKKASKK